MTWLLIAILSYFFYSIVSLTDKFLLSGLIPVPKVYAFYMGILGILALGLIPFVGFEALDFSQAAIALLAGGLFILASFFLYKALRTFDVTRIIPAIGGFLPLFTLTLTYLFSQGKEVLTLGEFIAFLLLVLGSVLITIEKRKFITLKSLQLSALSAFLFSLSFILTKYIYTIEPFWAGFIWMRIGGFLIALCFLFSREVREELFQKRITFQKKTAALFVSNQAIGALAFILLNWAIALAPLIYLGVINALGGTEYVFLFIFSVFLSLKFPQIIKEEISRGIIIQKIIAILLIGGGLTLLAFK